MNTEIAPSSKSFQQTEAGPIPADWSFGTVNEFWSVTDCKHVTAEFIPNGYPVASIMEVQSRTVDLSNANHTNEKFYKLLIDGNRKPRNGDLILSRNATVGEVAQVTDSHPDFAMGQDVCLLRKRRSEYSTSYFQALFRSPIIERQLANCMVGSTFKRVNVQQVKNLLIPFPEASEQQAIADALGDADAWIESLEGLIAKKRHLKQAAMQQLLTGKRRLPGFEGDWMTGFLSKFCSRITDGEHLTPLRSSGGYYLLSARNILNGRIDLRDVDFVEREEYDRIRRRCNPETGDVLVSCSGTIGRVAIVPPGLECVLVRSAALIKPAPNILNGSFAQYLLQSESTQKQIWRSVNQGAQPNLFLGQIESLSVSVPKALDEQIAIAEALTNMDNEIAALEAKLAKARDIKQGMMQQLLTGKIRLV